MILNGKHMHVNSLQLKGSVQELQTHMHALTLFLIVLLTIFVLFHNYLDSLARLKYYSYHFLTMLSFQIQHFFTMGGFTFLFRNQQRLLMQMYLFYIFDGVFNP